MAKKTMDNPYGYSSDNPYKYNPAAAGTWEKSQKKVREAQVKKEEDSTAKKAASDAELAQKSEEIRKRFAGFAPQQIESVAGTGPKEMQDILAQRKQALAGFNAPQLAAMQAQMAGGQQAAEQQRNRALQAALARQGVRGGAAASLQAQAGQMAAREKAAADTQLMLQQAAQQEKALGAYEQGVSGALSAEQARQFQGLAAQLAAEQQIAALEAAGMQKEATESYGTSMEKASKKGKIICTELHAQGLMDTEVFEADQAFGAELMKTDPEVMIGYHAWATGAVELMQRSRFWTFVAYLIATPWSKQMAFQMGVAKRPNLIGWVIMKVGMPFCRMIGRSIAKRGIANG